MTDQDGAFMARALALAESGLGRVAPNPSVGCIVVQNGAVVGAARTADGGRPHAETQALAQAGPHARGATVYVTLEPCCHDGRTPPCTDALIAAGVSRVVIACLDQDRRVAGQGAKALQEAGIAVVTGLCGEEAELLNEGFFKRISQYRPMITLKTAMSLDGKIASGEERLMVTGDAATARVHRERARHDAILTGIGTVLRDDPLLTARFGFERPSSVRVVLDTHLRFPVEARMAGSLEAGGVWILTAPGGDPQKKALLAARGMQVVEIPLSGHGKISLPFALEYLAAQGITRLMVEAGQQVFSAFFTLKLWDVLMLLRAPIVVGPHGLDAFGPDGARARRVQALSLVSQARLGKDTLEIYRQTP